MFFFDTFSRGVGITLIVILGLMRVTHRYRPGPLVDIAAFALATVVGICLSGFGGHEFHLGPAVFLVTVNVLTLPFLLYFTWRVRKAGATGPAVWTGLATTAGIIIAIAYDFFPLPGDDAHRTVFATAALATWGTPMFVYFFACRALDRHDDQATGTRSVPTSPIAAREEYR